MSRCVVFWLIFASFALFGFQAVDQSLWTPPLVHAPHSVLSHTENTSVCGPIASDTTWSTAGSVYVLTCDVTVNAGVTLTIQPGVVVKFNDAWTDLWVNGRLIAQGSVAQPVVFTSLRDDAHGGDTNGDGSATQPNPNDWAAIQFTPTSAGSILEYAWIGYGGGNEPGSLVLDTTNVTIQNNTFWRSGDHAIYLDGLSNNLDATYPFQLTGNTFITASLNAVYAPLSNDAVNIILEGNSGRGSAVNGLAINGSMSGINTLQADSTTSNFSILLSSDLTVNSGAQLSITPSTVVKFRDFWTDLYINGTLIAEGTPAEAVYFTSFNDDAHGGDTNNNGAATQPNPNDWSAIHFLAGSADNLLKHTWIGYGGGNEPGSVIIRSSDTRLEYNMITRSGERGVHIQLASPVLFGNDFQNNVTGIYLQEAAPFNKFNRMDGNTSYGLQNVTSTTCADARENDWGDGNGPDDPSSSTCACSQGTHPNAAGDNVSDHVLYSSWRSAPLFFLVEPFDSLWHGQEVIAWGTLGAGDPSQYQVDLQLIRNGQTTSLGSGLAGEGSTLWDTTSLQDGAVALRAQFYDGGVLAGEYSLDGMINNAILWHSGLMTTNATWGAASVHAVDGELSLASGVTLTIEPGAVVKFGRSARLVIQDGAILSAAGAAQSPVVLTSLADDSVGGDTNLDGNQTLPIPGDWNGIQLLGSGQFIRNEYTGLRYLQVIHYGTVAASETWLAGSLHVIQNDVTIPSGVTVDIQAGAVVKFNLDRILTVAAGGSLHAQGSASQPVTFTSIRDDSAGGDANNDGNLTVATPGDWRYLYVNGGEATLDHVVLTYGGGLKTGGWNNSGMLRTGGASSVTVSNSIIQKSLYDGVLAQGGLTTLENNLITGNDRGVVAWLSSATVHATNNTLDGNKKAFLAHGGTLNITNNLITNNTLFGIECDINPIPTVRYNNVWNVPAGGADYGGYLASQTGVNGNVSVNPLYQDRTKANFRLDYASPVIDAADGPAAPETDLMDSPALR